MKKRKPVSILKRSTTSHSNKKQKKSIHASSDDDHTKSQKMLAAANMHPRNNSKSPPKYVKPLSDVHRYASTAVERLLHSDATGKHGASLKSLTLAPNIPNKRAVYAVTIETLKYLPVLEKLVERTGILQQQLRISPSTAYVLIRDLLWGEGLESTSRGDAETAISSYKNDLLKQVLVLQQEENAESMLDLLPAVKFAAIAAQRTKTVRVNELKMSVNEALHWIEDNHKSNATDFSNKKKKRRKIAGANSSIQWQMIVCVFISLQLHIHYFVSKILGIVDCIRTNSYMFNYLQERKSITRDDHLPEVLHFPPQSDLHDHPLVQSGHWILQSKASCMTARALDPGVNWIVIDACAAPGNKTTQLAAIISSSTGTNNDNENKKKRKRKKTSAVVIAFDKDNNRLERLKQNVLLAGAEAFIDARCADFLSIDPQSPEFSDVKGILLDPSCSGSGTVFSRMDYLLPSAIKKTFGRDSITYSDSRVELLAAFQKSALLHAFKFPNVERVAYSTCSVHSKENEEVVAGVLKEAKEQYGFELAMALPQWPRRGISLTESDRFECDEDDLKGIQKNVVRTDPFEDGTDGFFVAVFERNLSCT